MLLAFTMLVKFTLIIIKINFYSIKLIINPMTMIIKNEIKKKKLFLNKYINI